MVYMQMSFYSETLGMSTEAGVMLPLSTPPSAMRDGNTRYCISCTGLAATIQSGHGIRRSSVMQRAEAWRLYCPGLTAAIIRI